MRCKAATWTLSLFLLLGGCLEMEVAVTLRADGSGRQELRLAMTDRVIDSVRKAAQAVDAGAGAERQDPLEVFDREKVEGELRAQGLRMHSYKSYRERQRQVVEVAADFGGIRQLERSSLLGGRAEWYLLKGRNPGGVRVVFYPQGHAAFCDAIGKARLIRAQPDERQQQFFATQQRRLGGLCVSFRVDLPGDVDYCSTNLVKTGARQVEATVRASDIDSASDLVLALAPRFEVEFDGRGCELALDAKEPPLPEKDRAEDGADRSAGGAARTEDAGRQAR